MYHLHQEAEPSDRTALEAVVDHIREEMERLHAQVRRTNARTGVRVVALSARVAVVSETTECHSIQLLCLITSEGVGSRSFCGSQGLDHS